MTVVQAQVVQVKVVTDKTQYLELSQLQVEAVVENKVPAVELVALVEAVVETLALVDQDQDNKVLVVEEQDTEIMVVKELLEVQVLVVVEAQVALVHLVHKVLVVVLEELIPSQMEQLQ